MRITTSGRTVKKHRAGYLATAGAVFMVAAGATLLGVTPAAAATCSQASCTGKDPETTGCSSADTYTSEWVGLSTGAGLELRHSKGCHVWWARFNEDIVDCCFPDFTMKIERQLKTPYGYYDVDVYKKSVTVNHPNTAWTAMVENSSDDRVRACVGSTCTSWHY